MQISKFPLWICALMLCGAPTLQAVDNPDQAAARRALEQKMNELDASQSAIPAAPAAVAPVAPVAAASTVPPAAAVAAPAAAATATAVEVTPAGAAPVVETPAPAPTVDTGDTVVMTPVNNKQAKAKQEAVVAATKPEANAPEPKPMPVPALPIPLSKAEKLNQLLAHYKADQITPEQYHTQRAAILAEP